jgi:pilus assembly protein CpaF
MELKNHLHATLVRLIDPRRVANLKGPGVLRLELRLVVERLIDELDPLLNRMERERTILEVVADAVGFGPLEVLP